jgi:hypothetical protein
MRIIIEVPERGSPETMTTGSPSLLRILRRLKLAHTRSPQFRRSSVNSSGLRVLEPLTDAEASDYHNRRDAPLLW